ncbi:MAG: hypothetical protein AB4426_15330 [Xenococcaceae cyanobacterium]
MFNQPLIQVWLLGSVVGILFIWSCAPSSDSTNISPTLKPTTIADNLIESEIKTLRGKLIYEEIPPVRSVRAYGGDEFFLITNPEGPRRLVLRPSEKVSRTELQSFHNQQVEVTAVYLEGYRPSPENPCPIDLDGQCLRQGDGYQVLSITQSR